MNYGRTTIPKNIFSRSEKLVSIYGFDDRLFIPAGIFVLSFLIPLIFFGEKLVTLEAYIPKWTSAAVYCTIYWLSIRAIMRMLRMHFPLAKDTPRRLVLLLPAVVILIFCCEFLSAYLGETFESFKSHKPLTIQTSSASVFSSTLVILIYEVKYLFVKYRHAEVQQAELRKENIQSQLDLLKSQVNPHFLFNSLNTLIYIIPEDPESAVQFVHRLSKTYRNILQYRNETLITLEKELSNLQDYLFLQKQRFQQNLNVHIDVDAERLNQWIVPLSVQMLIENAIKHNILSKSKPLFIKIESNGNQLIVRNNLQRKHQKVEGTKLGLSNIQSRYELLLGSSIEIIETADEFSVKLPLIQNAEYANRNN